MPKLPAFVDGKDDLDSWLLRLSDSPPQVVGPGKVSAHHYKLLTGKAFLSSIRHRGHRL